MYALEVCFLYLDLVGRFGVHLEEQLIGELGYVYYLSKVVTGQSLLIYNVEGVGEVFEPNEDFIFVERKQSISCVAFESGSQLFREFE